MMNTSTMTRRTYEAPDASVERIELEQTILSEVRPNSLQDMDENGLYDEVF